MVYHCLRKLSYLVIFPVGIAWWLPCQGLFLFSSCTWNSCMTSDDPRDIATKIDMETWEVIVKNWMCYHEEKGISRNANPEQQLKIQIEENPQEPVGIYWHISTIKQNRQMIKYEALLNWCVNCSPTMSPSWFYCLDLRRSVQIETKKQLKMGITSFFISLPFTLLVCPLVHSLFD